MSEQEQLYRVCWQVEGGEVQRGAPTTKAIAQDAAEAGNQNWGRMIRHWVEPVPPYAPPAITHEGDLETRAGSPLPCGDDDLLGVKPPC